MSDDIKPPTVFQRFKRAMRPVLSFLAKYLRDWSLNLAGVIAYSLLVTLIPMAIAFLGALGLFLKDHPNAQKKLEDQIVNLFSNYSLPQAEIKQIVNLAFMKLKADAGALLAIGIILAILGASRFYAALDDCFTIIYRLPQRSSLRQNLVAIGMVFMFILLFVLIIVANIVPLFLVIGIENYGARSGIYLLGFLCSLLATFIEFEIIYWVIPNKKMSFKVTWCGALVGAFLLEIVLMWFPLYVRDNTNSYTGILGFLIILILFLYYASLILLLGAQINAHCFEHYLPYENGIGTCLSQLPDKFADNDSIKQLVDETADAIPLQQQ